MSTFIGSSLRLNGPSQNDNNQLVGRNAGLALTFGNNHNFFGYYAGRNTTFGSHNNFIGSGAGASNVNGSFNNSIGFYAGSGFCGNSGSDNNFFGRFAGRFASTGACNNFIGYRAGCSNTSGCNNIAIGQNSGRTGVTPNGLFNLTTTSNRIIMGNASHSCAQIQIGWTTVSDVRDKCIYGSIDRGLGFLKGITPIEYQFKDRENDEITDPIKKRRYGFSAQEILELEGDHPVIVSDEDPDKLQLTTDHLLPVMVNAIKELAEQLEQQQQRIEALEHALNE